MSNKNLDIQYNYAELLESEVEKNPVDQFGKWYDDAKNSGILLPNAFCLATASSDSRPNARMILLKGYDDSGFVFYTNSESIKGIELQQNPQSSMVFWWDKLERQVRITGSIIILPDKESDEYFQSRPRGSQIGAWVSKQSSVIESREVLESSFTELEKKYENVSIPRPVYWNGYKLKPAVIEFWQGRPNRLHDRLKYMRADDMSWVIQRLAP
jgi:pyridoxamine 5'-phosphate oxidase